MEMFGCEGSVSRINTNVDDTGANGIVLEGDKVMGFTRMRIHLSLLCRQGCLEFSCESQCIR